jgi:hypothetical protein
MSPNQNIRLYGMNALSSWFAKYTGAKPFTAVGERKKY